MKELYLDIMEKSLSAYTPERIREYIDEVKRDGLTEHGFPRLGSNIGILMAYGRCTDMMDTFIEIMDICCEQMPQKRARNDFSVREVCCCLALMNKKGLLEPERFEKWKAQLATFDPWKCYTVVSDHSGKFFANWALFATVSEFIRGKFCGIDTSEFVEWQLPSQLANFDQNGMYKDHPPFDNHTVYDLVPRQLIAFLLRAGYRGKYAARMEEILDQTADYTLKMQSVNGEIAFGGRSNQFLNNEAMFIAYCEIEAARFAKKGDMEKAGQFKAAALLAAKSNLEYLSLDPIHHIKNRYPLESKIGCEGYGYFNKYMITTASNIYMGILFGDDTIEPTVAPATAGGYFHQTGEHFHRAFLNCGGYFLEWDTNADPQYDANGLGRVHKAGVPAPLCLSVPFSVIPHYVLEKDNHSPMSLCCFAEDGGQKLLGAERYAQYSLADAQVTSGYGEVTYDVRVAYGITLRQKHCVSERGIDITLSGYDKVGFMVPVFESDGAEEAKIDILRNRIRISYQGATCTYRVSGDINPEDYTYFYNRNGRYRVYALYGDRLHIELTPAAKETDSPLMKKAKTKEFWDEVREGADYKELREQIRGIYEKDRFTDGIPTLRFAPRHRFYTDGDRSEFEAAYFRRRRALASTALMALIYPEEQAYIPELEELIWATCEEYTWALPAHCKGVCPDIETIDLFCAETGFSLAEILHFLKDRLNERVVAFAYHALKERILDNFERHDYYWERVRSNWAAVCAGNVGGVLLYAFPERVEEFLPRLLSAMEFLMSSYPPDGTCLEGAGYWHYGFGNFVWFADLLYQFTDGATDLFQWDKVEAVAGFMQRIFMKGNTSVSFADGGRSAKMDRALQSVLRKRFPQQISLMDADKYTYSTGNVMWMQCFRNLYYLDPIAPAEKEVLKDHYLPDAGQVILHRANYSLTAKAGDNMEPHNHNDVGNFILSTEKGQVLCDFGAGRYTRQYFDKSIRYDFFICSSKGHSVPIINGQYQGFGSEYRGTMEYKDNVVRIDFKDAYPLNLQTLERTFAPEENKITLTDRFDCNYESFTERFVSFFEPKLSDGIVELADVKIIYDPEKCTPHIFAENVEQHTKPTNMLSSPFIYCLDFELKAGLNEISFEFKF